jgi:tetratricopeptide (TPR) repeat protein
MKVLSEIVLVGLVAMLSVPVIAQTTNTVQHAQALQRYRAGQELLRAEQFDKAAAEFSAAIDLDPLLALAHYGLGQSYVGLKRYASAVQAFVGCREAYRKIIAMREENRAETETRIDDEIRELQEIVVAIRGGRFRGYGESKITELETRIDDLRRLRQEPVSVFRPPAEVSLALGSAYFRNGDRDRAEAEWKTAIEVNPRLGEAHNNLAVVYMMTNRFELAENAIKAAEKAGYRVNPQLKQDVKTKKAASR